MSGTEAGLVAAGEIGEPPSIRPVYVGRLLMRPGS